MIYLGLDPGTQDNMAIAAVWPGKLRVALVDGGEKRDARDRAPYVYTQIVEAYGRLDVPSGSATIAVEWQRPLPGDKRPQNISDLSAFAGLALATIQSFYKPLSVTVFCPLPQEWKGEVPKHIKHNRIVAAAGGSDVVMEALWSAGITVPSHLGQFTKTFTGRASDAIDAIGLALWARGRAALLGIVARGILPPPRS